MWLTYRTQVTTLERAKLSVHAADLDTTHTPFITDIDRACLGSGLVQVGEDKGVEWGYHKSFNLSWTTMTKYWSNILEHLKSTFWHFKR